MKKLIALFVLLAPPAAFGQHRSVVVLGAGAVGSWDTKITVTNPGSTEMPITISPSINEGPEVPPCLQPGICGDFARVSIAPFGTYVLPAIPQGLIPPIPTAPQPVYVAAPSAGPLPLVSAYAGDTAAACSRGESLPAVAADAAFDNRLDIIPGARRDADTHVNLFLAGSPLEPLAMQIRVCAFDANGNVLSIKFYAVAPGQSLFIQDLLLDEGLLEMEEGSLQIDEPGGSGKWAAVMTIVGSREVRAVTGSRLP